MTQFGGKNVNHEPGIQASRDLLSAEATATIQAEIQTLISGKAIVTFDEFRSWTQKEFESFCQKIKEPEIIESAFLAWETQVYILLSRPEQESFTPQESWLLLQYMELALSSTEDSSLGISITTRIIKSLDKNSAEEVHESPVLNTLACSARILYLEFSQDNQESDFYELAEVRARLDVDRKTLSDEALKTILIKLLALTFYDVDQSQKISLSGEMIGLCERIKEQDSTNEVSETSKRENLLFLAYAYWTRSSGFWEEQIYNSDPELDFLGKSDLKTAHEIIKQIKEAGDLRFQIEAIYVRRLVLENKLEKAAKNLESCLDFFLNNQGSILSTSAIERITELVALSPIIAKVNSRAAEYAVHCCEVFLSLTRSLDTFCLKRLFTYEQLLRVQLSTDSLAEVSLTVNRAYLEAEVSLEKFPERSFELNKACLELAILAEDSANSEKYLFELRQDEQWLMLDRSQRAEFYFKVGENNFADNNLTNSLINLTATVKLFEGKIVTNKQDYQLLDNALALISYVLNDLKFVVAKKDIVKATDLDRQQHVFDFNRKQLAKLSDGEVFRFSDSPDPSFVSRFQGEYAAERKALISLDKETAKTLSLETHNESEIIEALTERIKTNLSGVNHRDFDSFYSWIENSWKPFLTSYKLGELNQFFNSAIADLTLDLLVKARTSLLPQEMFVILEYVENTLGSNFSTRKKNQLLGITKIVLDRVNHLGDSGCDSKTQKFVWAYCASCLLNLFGDALELENEIIPLNDSLRNLLDQLPLLDVLNHAMTVADISYRTKNYRQAIFDSSRVINLVSPISDCNDPREKQAVFCLAHFYLIRFKSLCEGGVQSSDSNTDRLARKDLRRALKSAKSEADIFEAKCEELCRLQAVGNDGLDYRLFVETLNYFQENSSLLISHVDPPLLYRLVEAGVRISDTKQSIANWRIVACQNFLSATDRWERQYAIERLQTLNILTKHYLYVGEADISKKLAKQFNAESARYLSEFYKENVQVGILVLEQLIASGDLSAASSLYRYLSASNEWELLDAELKSNVLLSLGLHNSKQSFFIRFKIF
ncbi:MAG: hypothetical protein R3A13_03825 [Bdellovibrionota bacterium]